MDISGALDRLKPCTQFRQKQQHYYNKIAALERMVAH